MALSLVWDRPTETTNRTPISSDVELSYQVFSSEDAIPREDEQVATTRETHIALSMLSDAVGKYLFVRAVTANGTKSSFSSPKLVGVPRAPSGLRIEDI